MFKCADCGQTTEPRAVQHTVITQKRVKEYNNNGVVSKGWEIVEEQKVCLDCYEQSPLTVNTR